MEQVRMLQMKMLLKKYTAIYKGNTFVDCVMLKKELRQNITDEIIYQDIKKALNGRSYLSSYNIDKFQEALNPYRTILSQYIDNNDIKKYIDTSPLKTLSIVFLSKPKICVGLMPSLSIS